MIFKYLYPLSGEFYFKDWFPSLFGAAWAFVMIVIFLYWICIKYYVTNLRLIEERGIIGKRIMSIWLDKVQDVTCQFGILGRIFGFGDLEIQSARTYGKIVFSFLPSPRKLREKVEEELLKYRQHPPWVNQGGSVASTKTKPSISQICAQNQRRLPFGDFDLEGGGEFQK